MSKQFKRPGEWYCGCRECNEIYGPATEDLATALSNPTLEVVRASTPRKSRKSWFARMRKRLLHLGGMNR